MTLATLPVVLLIGALVGLLPGLFGVGGAFIMVPALNMLAGVPLDVAIGTSACQVLGPATTGLLHRRGTGKLHLQLPLCMAGGGCVGIALGILFVKWAGKTADTIELAGRSVPRLETIMLTSYFALLVLLALIVFLEWRTQRGPKQVALPGRLATWRVPPLGQFEELAGGEFSLSLLAALGVLVGFLNCGMGMGGGIVMMPALVALVGVPTERAITATLVFTWLAAIGVTVGHAIDGRVDLQLVAVLLAGGTLGGKLGSLLGERLGGHRLRGYFSLLVLAVAVAIGAKLVWLFRS